MKDRWTTDPTEVFREIGEVFTRATEDLVEAFEGIVDALDQLAFDLRDFRPETSDDWLIETWRALRLGQNARAWECLGFAFRAHCEEIGL